MTPGFAKRRSEVPWLPYPENDRVIINPHRLPAPAGGFDGSINGKTPVACWCPTHDSSGYGTTTMYDLSGNSNDVALNSIDTSTFWVSDTGAGGSYAIDSDGVDDYGLATDSADLDSVVAMSFWLYPETGGSWQRIFYGKIDVNFNRTDGRFRVGSKLTATGVCTLGSWQNFVLVENGSNVDVYRNNVFITSLATLLGMNNATDLKLMQFASADPSFNYYGKMDDIRMFDQSLDAADRSDLYASGAGRGVS